MKRKATRRTAKKRVAKRANRGADATNAMTHSVLGKIAYQNMIWQTLEPIEFGVLGNLQVVVEAELEAGPTSHQIKALRQIQRGPVGIRNAIARGLKDEFDIAELDEDERDGFSIKKRNDVWNYARISTIWLTEEKGTVKFEIRVEWDHHTCIATIHDGKVKSVIIP